jgi:MFS family permease
MKKSFALITLGAILEYYDFAIFIYFAKSIGESLIPIHNESANIIASFGIFAIGALLRPLGGIVFAHFGDTRGRKKIFVYTVLLMAIPTFLIAFIPSYQNIGIFATIILILLRAIQGLAIGGEIPGSVVFAYELSKPQNKAFNTNIVIAGTNIGFFLASMLGAVLLSKTDLGFAPWRIAFILGGVFGVISYYLRKNLLETPEFASYKQFIDRQPRAPFKQLWDEHKTAIWQMVSFGSLLASSLAVYTFFMPTYLATYYHFPMAEILKYNSYSIIIFIVSAFLAGKFHYFFGKSFLIISVIIFNLVNFTLFTQYASLSLMQIVAFHYVILLYIGIICGRLPVLSASFFPVQVRYSGVGLSYNISFGIVAGLTQMLLFAGIKLTGLLWLPAIYILLFSIFALIFLFKVSAEKLVNYY